MPSLRLLIFLSLSILTNLVHASEPQQNPTPSSPTPHDREIFNELLKVVPEESLHAALHTHLTPKYQDGVFEYDKKAVQKVHEDNPPLASKVILAAAKLELLKRQNASVPISTPTPPPAGNPPPASTDIVVPVPVTLSSTDQAGSAVVVTSSTAIPVPVTSVVVPITATDAAGNTIIASSAAPAVVLTTTDSAGGVVAITSQLPPLITPTPGQTVTTTDAQGHTFVTVVTPGGGKATSLVVLTQTLSNGQVVTRTETVLAGGDQATGTDAGANGASSTRAPAGLQTGAAAKGHVNGAVVIGGAVMGLGWLI